MNYALRWRKAITTSLGFHIIILIMSGYAAAHIPVLQPVPEQYIELALGSVIQEQTSASMPQATASVPVPETSLPLSDQRSAVQPVVAVDDSLAVLAAETPAGASAVSGNQTVTSTNGSSGAELAGAGGSTSALGGGGNPVSAGIRSDASLIPPRVLSRKDPEYPPAARQAALQGRVVLKVQILENGRAGEIAIARSSGQELLDEAAVAAVSQWQFVPAREPESGRAVICYSTVPVSFRLQ